MKTSLKVLALSLAVGFPSALLAEASGLRVPAVFDAQYALSAYFAAFIVLVSVSDYSRRSRAQTAARASLLRRAKLPYAA
jgi:hypothetical protein